MPTNEPKSFGRQAERPFDLQSRPSLARGVRLQTDASTNEPVLLFPEGVLHLNPTAHDIVSRCDGQRTTEAIIASLAEEYDVANEMLRGDVLDCLRELHQRNLLVFSA
jgi:pyrroloquinoline quinone biosynthesis protein D